MDVSVLLEPTVDLKRLSEILDGLGHEGRRHTLRTWSPTVQARLFEAAKDYRPLKLDFLVPASVPPGHEVVHDGQNTLPAFRHFQKRFCKLTHDSVNVVGYNHHALQRFTGPGYFVASEGAGEHEGELAIDYTVVPATRPPGGPVVRANDGGIGALVYGGMVDYLRGISAHVSIGRAFKGKSMNAWFALVRKDIS